MNDPGKIAIVSAVVAALALLGSVVGWIIQAQSRVTHIEAQEAGEAQWFVKMIAEREKRFDQRMDSIEKRVGKLEDNL